MAERQPALEDLVVARRALAEEALWQRSLQLRALTAELTLPEDRERRRLAAVLHDDLQQLLVGARFREATRAIHAEWPEIQVIGLSMYPEAEKGSAMREAGAVNYLSKLGPSEALLAAIRACARPEV